MNTNFSVNTVEEFSLPDGAEQVIQENEQFPGLVECCEVLVHLNEEGYKTAQKLQHLFDSMCLCKSRTQ